MAFSNEVESKSRGNEGLNKKSIAAELVQENDNISLLIQQTANVL